MYDKPNINTSPFPTINRLGTVMGRLTSDIFGFGQEYVEFSRVFDKVPSPILVTTSDVQIVYVNPAWERLTGYKLEELEGKNPRILKSSKTPKTIFKKMWISLKKGESFHTEEMIDVKKNGEEFQINTTIFPITKTNNLLFYVQITEDISNRKKMEALKREFLSNATHELKTPITTLKLMIESQIRNMIRHNHNKLQTVELSLIDHELNRLTRIIDDLSDVSRIEAGKLRLDLKVIDINKLIYECVHQMMTIAGKHKIIYLQSGPIYTIADETRIKQVLINLIKNAIKYSYSSSKVTIEVKVEKKYCVISVENKGVGIPKSKQSYIFDKFFQLKSDSTGLGLGLYISKKIIEQHKGKIWLRSIKGKITTFYFSLLTANLDS